MKMKEIEPGETCIPSAPLDPQVISSLFDNELQNSGGSKVKSKTYNHQD